MKQEMTRAALTFLNTSTLRVWADEPELSVLPGAEQWMPYLKESPLTPQMLAEEPLGAVRQLLPETLWQTLGASLRGSAGVLSFLVLAAFLSLLVGDSQGRKLLDLAAAGGCGVMLWGRLTALAEALCGQAAGWRDFLMGFLPVYAGALALGGETAAGGAASGFLLSMLCLLAQLLEQSLPTLLKCYLALSMTCCVSSDRSLAAACRASGSLLRQALGWTGKALAVLLGLQRAAALQLDRTALRAGQWMAGSVPIVGQALSDASEALLAAVQLLKSGLGLAAIGWLLAEFAPLYLALLVQLLFLDGCGLFCGMTDLTRGKELMDCLAEAMRCMAASVALFFGLAVLGTAILFVVGGG